MTMKRFLLATISALVAFSSHAEVKLPAFFSDNMVMQRNAQAPIWGKAKPGKTVKIKTSWNGKTYSVQAANDSTWSAKISTPDAGGPYEISLSDGKETLLKNVMIGEVWLCSGQSNMEMPMKGYKNQPVEGAGDAILHSRNPQLRLFTVKRCASLVPQNDVKGHWDEAQPESVREFSATAYYFGHLLQELLNVPVGLIVTSWGGSACEAWCKAEWMKPFEKVVIPTSQEQVNKTQQRCPTALFNGMLHPLIGLRIAGAIWYQGEDNWPRYNYYADLFSNMVKGWREEWQQGDFPFYYCQIAPYDYTRITAKDETPVNSAYLREQQFKAEKMIPNCGMAVLLDAGLEEGIHPTKKKTAGERLARLALSKTYGIKGIPAESPKYDHFELKGDTIVCFFRDADMWINCNGHFESKNFEIAGSDRHFYTARAWIYRSKMYVKSDSVPNPVAVRYAFKDYVVGDVFSEDLPASSFRTDEW